MRLATAFLATLLLAPALVPLVGAQWGGKGTWEPDTLEDATGPFMWPGPDQHPSATQRRIYFNGFNGAVLGLSTTLNPNVGLLQTSVLAHPYQPYALLGVWKDCNRDGYIGLGDNGALEYRAETLLERHVCPADTSGNPLAHNDGQWVVELIPIGYDDVRAGPGGASVDENPRNYNDTGARVWADWGLPDAPVRGSCSLEPTHGTLRSTGGMLRWADCLDDYRATTTLSTLVEAAGRRELSFSDAPRDRPDQSRSSLNVRNPYGQGSDASMARAFDCSAPPQRHSVRDPTAPQEGTGMLYNIVGVPLPGGSTFYVSLTDREGRIVNKTTNQPVVPTLDPARGSPAGTINETEEGALEDCDRSDGLSASDTPYSIEGANEPVSGVTGRTRSDHVFKFEESDNRVAPLRGLVPGRPRPDAGLGVVDHTGLWVGQGSTATSRNPFVAREDVQPEPVVHVTFYAYMTQALLDGNGLSLPAKVFGIYGAEACARTPSPFVCDSSRWWRDAGGRDVMPRDYRLGAMPNEPTTPLRVAATEVGVRVGQPYQLRDIDCFDASGRTPRSVGVHYGILSDSACARPAAPGTTSTLGP